MMFVITGICTTLCLRLRSFRGWAAVLLLPMLAAAALVLIPGQEAAAPVQVGVCLPRRGGEAFREALEARSGTVMEFIFADEARIDRNVAAGRWDCGLILAEDFDDRLEDLETDRLITLRVSSGSVVYPLVRETVSACVAELVSPYIALDYLSDNEILPDSSFRLETLGTADRVTVRLTDPEGRILEPAALAARTRNTVALWLVSAVILVRMLLAATDLGKWLERGAVKRMLPLRGKTELMLSRIGADALLLWVSGTAAAVILGAGRAGCLGVLGYVLFWTAAAVLAARVPGIRNAVPVCMPFLVVISLLLSSALVDVSVFLPRLAGPAEKLSVRLFLDTCAGNPKAALPLLLGAAAMLGISFIMDRPLPSDFRLFRNNA